MARQPPSGSRPPYHRGFTITLIHTTLDRTPLEGGSVRRREEDIHLLTKIVAGVCSNKISVREVEYARGRVRPSFCAVDVVRDYQKRRRIFPVD